MAVSVNRIAVAAAAVSAGMALAGAVVESIPLLGVAAGIAAAATLAKLREHRQFMAEIEREDRRRTTSVSAG
jgi:hypothetical protein